MRGRGIKRSRSGISPQITRRQLLAGAGAVTVAGSLGAVGLAKTVGSASAAGMNRALPAPSPIPGGVDAPPVGLIHWWLPGPEGSATQYIGLPGMGLDVDPSLLTDFQGFSTFAVIAGQAVGSDGKVYNVEFDVRVMEGEYIAENGSRQHGVFGFF